MSAHSAEQLREQANWTRFRPGQATGHYESFFQRANHPTRPLAFWIRYTIFSPQGRPGAAVGELWAILFNGETGRHIAVKQRVPLAACRFGPESFYAEIGGARLEPGRLFGSAESGGHALAWDLAFTGSAAPLLLLPGWMYAGSFPKAKSLVGLPMACFSGTLGVDGESLPVENWIGSANHNWGSRHTDDYAWGQVAGFDTHPDSFLEIASARLRFGPLWTPRMTPLVLRHAGREIALNALLQSVRARASLREYTWHFRSASADFVVEGEIRAPREAFVGLRYDNPPGGSKYCLNTKLASCTLTLAEKHAGRGSPQVLSCARRAAFEILTDDQTAGVTIQA